MILSTVLPLPTFCLVNNNLQFLYQEKGWKQTSSFTGFMVKNTYKEMPIYRYCMFQKVFSYN